MEPSMFYLVERFVNAVEKIANSVDCMSIDMRALNTNVSELRKESFCRSCRRDSPHCKSQTAYSDGEKVASPPPDQQSSCDSPISGKCDGVRVEERNIAESCLDEFHRNEREYTTQEEYSTPTLQATESVQQAEENSSIEPATSQNDAQGHVTDWDSMNCDDLTVTSGVVTLSDPIKKEGKDDIPEDNALGQDLQYFNLGGTSSVKEEWNATLEECAGDENIAQVVHGYQSGVCTSERVDAESAEPGTSSGIHNSPAHNANENETFRTRVKEMYQFAERYSQSAFPIASGSIGHHHVERTHHACDGNELEANVPLVCPVCARSFMTVSELTFHVLKHNTAQPFQCSICQKILSSKQSLKNHINYHFGRRQFQCTFCNKRFFQKIHLQDHIRVHTKEKPFQCPLCKESFAQQTNLRKHIRRHTGERPYPCPVCGKTFKERYDMKQHQHIHSRETFLSLP